MSNNSNVPTAPFQSSKIPHPDITNHQQKHYPRQHSSRPLYNPYQLQGCCRGSQKVIARDSSKPDDTPIHYHMQNKDKEDNKGSSVEVTNEETIFKILVYCVDKKKIIDFEEFNQVTLVVNTNDDNTNLDAYGRKIKLLPDLLYKPDQGTYPFTHKGKDMRISFFKGETVLTSPSRKVDSVKRILFSCDDPDPKYIKQMIADALEGYGESSESDMIIYQNLGGAWSKSKDKKSRTMDSVILDSQITETVLEDMKEFIDSEKWYKEMGVPYRRSYLFYGPPGTGKTSFAQALAGHLHFSVCFLNISDNMNDYNFNSLLNSAPLKSIILIEDVDAMFEGRKNKTQVNRLTYSGFLNAIDGVRSQEGRIFIMTTNHKEKLDPALLRPGRIDSKYQLDLASKSQAERMYLRFFGDQKLAKRFGELIPAKTFSMSQIQGFFVKYKRKSHLIIDKISQLLTSEENIKIEDFLESISCIEATGAFKLDNCFTLANVKNLPIEEIEKIVSGKLSTEKTLRLMEALRNNNWNSKTEKEDLVKYLETTTLSEDILNEVKGQIEKDKYVSLFHLKDGIQEKKSAAKAKEHADTNQAKNQKKKKNNKDKQKEEQKGEET